MSAWLRKLLRRSYTAIIWIQLESRKYLLLNVRADPKSCSWKIGKDVNNTIIYVEFRVNPKLYSFFLWCSPYVNKEDSKLFPVVNTPVIHTICIIETTLTLSSPTSNLPFDKSFVFEKRHSRPIVLFLHQYIWTSSLNARYSDKN